MLRPVLLLLFFPGVGYAHAIDDRYELPVPLTHFIVGATAAVALSFLIAAVWLRRPPPGPDSPGRALYVGSLVIVLRLFCRPFAVLLLAVTVAAGLFGTRDPMMNLAPTMVWVVWWVGLTTVVAFVGNVWPALDPWRALFDALNAAARALGRRKGIAMAVPYPKALGASPAALLLLLIGWLEVAYPESAEPRRIAQGLLWWSAVTLLGRVVFGRETWERNVDVFSIYFATLGRFSPLAPGSDARTIVVRSPGQGLLSEAASSATVAFVVAMLATVLFDGLLSGETWWWAQAEVTAALPQLAHPRGYFITALGLLGLWSAFITAYALSCWAAVHLAGDASVLSLSRTFAYTLVPIAIGYNVAHNLSNLLVQGQQIVPLLSDPLNLGWNLLGGANYRPDTRLVQAAGAWYIAVAAIVIGHAMAVWLAHRAALRTFGSPRRAALATAPLTAAMLIYTGVSLAVLAEPMVKFEGTTQSEP